MAKLLFMRLDGIEGEEPIGDSQKMIRIGSYSHSLGMQISPARPSLGADATLRRSYCQHGLFTVVKGFDKTSINLFDACCNGVVFKNVVIYVCALDKSPLTKINEPTPVLTISMSDAVMAAFDYDCHHEWPMERIGFHYTSISWEGKWKNPSTGASVTLTPSGWDGALNKEGSVAIPGTMKWS